MYIREGNFIDMKKKGKLSLTLALIHIILGLGLATLTILLNQGILKGSQEAWTLMRDYLAFTSGPLALISFSVFLIILGLEILICRKKRPFSYFILPFTWIIYFTLLVNVHTITGNVNPQILMATVNTARKGLMWVLLFLEVILTIILLIISRGLNAKYRKRLEFKEKKAELEREKRRANGEPEPLSKEEIAKARIEHKKEIRKAKKEKKESNKEPKPVKENKTKKEKPLKKNKGKKQPIEETVDDDSFVVTKKDQEEALLSPDEPITFPSFVPLPEFKTFSKPKEEKREEQEEDFDEPVNINPSTSAHVFEVMKEERERQEEEKFEKYDVSNPTKFKRGGILEAALESNAREKERENLNQGPIVGYDDIMDKKKPRETNEARIAPSTLSPNHPRYRMFEAIANGKNEAPVNQNPIIGYDDEKEKKEEDNSEESFAPSTLSPSHPRYKMFESLRRKKDDESKKEENTVSHFPTKPIEVKPEPAYTSHLQEAYEGNKNKPQERETPSFNPPIVETRIEQPAVVIEEKREEPTPVYTPPVVEERKETPTPVVETKIEKDEDHELPRSSGFYQGSSTAKPVNGAVIDDPVKEESKKNEIEFLVGVGGLSSNDMGEAAIQKRGRAFYSPPSLSLLVDYPTADSEIDEETKEQGLLIVEILRQFKVAVELINIVKGPTVTMFEFELAPGVLISKITGLQDNIALNLGGKAIRILAPIPGKKAVGIEVPNAKRGTVGFKEMMPSLNSVDHKVPMVLGKTITGTPTIIDVAKAPHLLIAGTTGSGKSVGINALICSILYTKSPKEVRLMMIDPKIVELKIYNGIPHLLTPVITDSKKVIKALAWLLEEMLRRYHMIAQLNARGIEAFNEKIQAGGWAAEKLPYIVLIMDEFADLMSTIGKDIEYYVGRLTAMSRAVGIHLVMATQRPSSEVVTGTIKSNLPSRISFTASSSMNSRIILDEMGAENLLGRGDMLYLDPGSSGTLRIQGAFLSDGEVEKVVQHAQSQGEPDYLDESIFEDEPEQDYSSSNEGSFSDGGDTEEDLYEEAKRICFERKSASASYLQRRMKIGFNRASRFVDRMEEEGIIGPAQGSKAREILRYE